MKTIEKTNKYVKIEITAIEMLAGFDVIWDEIREVYPKELYELESTEKISDEKLIIFTLRFKKKKGFLS